MIRFTDSAARSKSDIRGRRTSKPAHTHAPPSTDAWTEAVSQVDSGSSIIQRVPRRHPVEQDRQERNLTIVSAIGVGILLVLTFGLLAHKSVGGASEEVPLSISSACDPDQAIPDIADNHRSSERIGEGVFPGRAAASTAPAVRAPAPEIPEIDAIIASAAHLPGTKASPPTPENLSPENLSPENLSPENLSPENLSRNYVPNCGAAVPVAKSSGDACTASNLFTTTKAPAQRSEPLPRPRHPIPSLNAQQEIGRQLDEVYELLKPKTAAEMLQQAREMFDLARRSQGGPAERFVLLRTAAELAGTAGDAPIMLKIVDAIEAEFEIDVLLVKARLLRHFAGHATDEVRIESLVRASQCYIDQALAAQRCDLALTVAAAVYQTCQRSPGKVFRKEMFDRRREVQKLADQQQKVQDAATVLESNPDRPEANLVVGDWFCFHRDNWRRGLPHLAKGSDPVLARLARWDLTSPHDPADQVRLADVWWQVAENYQGKEKVAMLLRAGDWYRLARQTIQPGLVQVKLDKRLAEIARAGASPAPQSDGLP